MKALSPFRTPHSAFRIRAYRYGRAAFCGVFGAYVLMTGLLYSWQTWLIFPGAETQGRPQASLQTPAGAELVRLPTRGGPQAAALFGPAGKGAGVHGSTGQRGLHGNGLP